MLSVAQILIQLFVYLSHLFLHLLGMNCVEAMHAICIEHSYTVVVSFIVNHTYCSCVVYYRTPLETICDRACENRAYACGHKLHPVTQQDISQYWNELST